TPADWVLAFGEPDIDDVRVFVPQGDGFAEQKLGRRIPNSQLALAGLRHLARLDLPEGRPLTVLVRLESQHKIRFEQAALWRPDALMTDEARQAGQFGLQFGIMAVLVLVYGLFGLWLRDGPMLVYALFVATRLGRGMTHSGLVTLVFPDAGRGVNYLLGGIGLMGGIAAFIVMWDRILDLRRNFPRMHRAYMGAGGFVAVSLLFVGSPDFKLFVPPAQAIMFAASIANIVMAALLVRRNPGDVLLKFYLFAFLPLVLAWGAEVAAMVTPLVPADWGRGIDVTATMGHIAILSVALAYRLGQIQRQRMGAEIALAGERLARQRQRTFVDMATHEFKTPLAVIDSAAQMLEMLTAPARAEVGDRLATIRRAVQRLVKLVETCLADDRDQVMAAKLLPADPAAIVHLAAERNREGGEIVVRAASLPDAIRADAALLGIALDALIDNARRYGPAGQAVELSATAEDGRVAFAVHDRGPGIPPGEADRIFDKYYRGITSGPVPGTGIGLHLVKTIAELHGGTVTYVPRDGGGASFVVTVPA
ncbi:MAG TPA: ATP-binding protein, partial [Candidatus Omnitrophota bacterium]|nr:ATP-binding protein [Candidatus Omnitrophota bacterium]